MCCINFCILIIIIIIFMLNMCYEKYVKHTSSAVDLPQTMFE